MIDVSNEYITMMTGRKVQSRMEVLVRSNLTVRNLTDDDIVKGSWSMNWRASNNRSFSLGTCYSTSLSFSAFVSVEPEIEGQYVEIIPVVYYKVNEYDEEMIPLGEFRCDSPKVFNKTTSYDCYDAMLLFDQPIQSRFSGTPFNVLDFICTKCGVVLGNTYQDILRMVNPTQQMVIDPERVATYRDALSYISSVLGGYCIIGRDGKLYVRQFHTTADMEIPRHRRIQTSFGGYKTCFKGCKARFLAEQNFYPYESIDDEVEGIVVDLGDIPIIEDDEATKKEILDNITEMLLEIEYYPCEIEMVGDPSIEAGDMITTKDRYGYDKEILLTSVSYGWRASANILSEGANPKLQNVSTAEKRASSSMSAASKASSLVTCTYVNAGTIEVDYTKKEIVSSLRFVTNKDLTAIFGANIPVMSSGDGIVEFTYDDAGIEGDVFKARVHEGENILTLVNHLYYPANSVVNLHLRAKTYGIDGGSAPTLTIESDTIRSYVFAQGIETEVPWDGIIVISEEIGYVQSFLDLYEITDGVSVDIIPPVSGDFNQIISTVYPDVQTVTIFDTITLSLEYGDHILRCGMGHRAGMGRMFAPIPST